MKNKIILVLLTVTIIGFVGWKVFRDNIVATVCETNCSKTCEYEGKDFNKTASNIVSQPGAKKGEFTKCPLSKVVVKVTDETMSFEYNNNRYYTCCGTCAELIQKHPEKYLN